MAACIKRERDSGAAEQQQTPAKRFKSKYSSTTIILVGAEEAEFSIHPDRICERSGLIRTMHAKIGGRGDTINLPQIDPFTFNIYLDAIYSTKMPNVCELTTEALEDEQRPAIYQSMKQTERTLDALCKLWMLGIDVQDVVFSNTVMDAIINGFNTTTTTGTGGSATPSTVIMVINKTAVNSGLNKWIMRYGKVSEEVFVKLLKAVLKLRRGLTYNDVEYNTQAYHEKVQGR